VIQRVANWVNAAAPVEKSQACKGKANDTNAPEHRLGYVSERKQK
jgi:hypothetical protein